MEVSRSMPKLPALDKIPDKPMVMSYLPPSLPNAEFALLAALGRPPGASHQALKSHMMLLKLIEGQRLRGERPPLQPMALSSIRGQSGPARMPETAGWNAGCPGSSSAPMSSAPTSSAPGSASSAGGPGRDHAAYPGGKKGHSAARGADKPSTHHAQVCDGGSGTHGKYRGVVGPSSAPYDPWQRQTCHRHIGHHNKKHKHNQENEQRSKWEQHP